MGNPQVCVYPSLQTPGKVVNRHGGRGTGKVESFVWVTSLTMVWGKIDEEGTKTDLVLSLLLEMSFI